MNQPFTLLYDPSNLSSGDIDMSQGLRFTPDLPTYVIERLGENLQFFLGEWFLDLRQGIPYFERVYSEFPDLVLLDSLFRRAILGTPGVAALTTLLLSFDNPGRALFESFECVLADGSTITQGDLDKLLIVDF